MQKQDKEQNNSTDNRPARTDKYYIGMDAGGTGTTVLVSDGEKDLFRTAADGLNCNSYSREQIEASLLDITARLQAKGFAPENCIAMGIGAAGSTNPGAPALFSTALKKCGYSCPVSVFSDADAALFGALGEEDGILLISGTGSICLGQTDFGQTKYQAGGFGHLIDDEGSAYALGRDILIAAVKAGDGRIPSTALKGCLFRHLGISSFPELVGYVYDQSHTKKEIAALAPLLFLPENQNDAAAANIINKAIAGLLEMVKAVFGRMENRYRKESLPERILPLVLHGSVLRNNQRIAGELTAVLSRECPSLRIASAKADGAGGAVGIVCRRYPPQS